MVRPALIYGSETWPLKKKQEKKLEVAEIWMLRWSMGKTRKDSARNEWFKERTGVVEALRRYKNEDCNGMVTL